MPVGPSVVDTSEPLATAVTPLATVIVNVHVALSLGWSLLGSHVRAPSGSFSTYEPPSVLNQPAGSPAIDELSGDARVLDAHLDLGRRRPAGRGGRDPQLGVVVLELGVGAVDGHRADHRAGRSRA